MQIKQPSGFTLVETMVASAVLAVGVLTLAGMQAASITGGVDANELTLATNLAADMIERVRFTGDMNPPITNLYNGINTTNVATCNAVAQQQVRGDCMQWQTLLTSSKLQGIQGVVQVAPSGPTLLNASQVTVTISWTGSVTTHRSKSISFVTVIDPK